MSKISITAAALLLASFVVGCGGSDNSTGDEAAAPSTPAATATTTESMAASSAITIAMTEFAMEPKDAVAKAGKVTITGPNNGKVVHELVLLRTDADPAMLPMMGNDVDESTAVGEIADVEPGATKSMTLTLKPGKYVMVCALPGHYQSGMFGTVTVE